VLSCYAMHMSRHLCISMYHSSALDSHSRSCLFNSLCSFLLAVPMLCNGRWRSVVPRRRHLNPALSLLTITTVSTHNPQMLYTDRANSPPPIEAWRKKTLVQIWLQTTNKCHTPQTNLTRPCLRLRMPKRTAMPMYTRLSLQTDLMSALSRFGIVPGAHCTLVYQSRATR